MAVDSPGKGLCVTPKRDVEWVEQTGVLSTSLSPRHSSLLYDEELLSLSTTIVKNTKISTTPPFCALRTPFRLKKSRTICTGSYRTANPSGPPRHPIFKLSKRNLDNEDIQKLQELVLKIEQEVELKHSTFNRESKKNLREMDSKMESFESFDQKLNPSFLVKSTELTPNATFFEREGCNSDESRTPENTSYTEVPATALSLIKKKKLRAQRLRKQKKKQLTFQLQFPRVLTQQATPASNFLLNNFKSTPANHHSEGKDFQYSNNNKFNTSNINNNSSNIISNNIKSDFKNSISIISKLNNTLYNTDKCANKYSNNIILKINNNDDNIIINTDNNSKFNNNVSNYKKNNNSVSNLSKHCKLEDINTIKIKRLQALEKLQASKNRIRQ